MKNIVFTLLLVIAASSLSFSQNSGSISGTLLDLESNNAPLTFARVKIKETGAEVLSDENGVFRLNNLEAGAYTLIYSFVGYETKETEVKITSNKSTNITLHLAASTISLDDLVMAIASTDEKSTTSTN
ncbi:carboxypeptidase-like regulatory domain-containing protein [Cognatitamlana onchidii]|uniref:carboxypeptidase-like regulatory domain-containing protein n=1 Tax=Cognatitamlana onchidii TaxID=2562860 RepID=UPI0010A5FF4A|nr:carboxypeptidase-like regulatory domain-containing protein [Algibacter onchidii]